MNLSGLRLSGLRLLVLLICQIGLLHVGTLASAQDNIRPKARTNEPVATRWTHRPGHATWEQAAISALKTHASGLVEMCRGISGRGVRLIRTQMIKPDVRFGLGFCRPLRNSRAPIVRPQLAVVGAGMGCCRYCRARRGLMDVRRGPVLRCAMGVPI